MPGRRLFPLWAVTVIGAAIWAYSILMCLGINPFGIPLYPGIVGAIGAVAGCVGASAAVAAWNERYRPWKR